MHSLFSSCRGEGTLDDVTRQVYYVTAGVDRVGHSDNLLSVINVECSACGGESQFEEATAEKEQPCPLCHAILNVTPTKSATELSEEEQMAQYEEALKETDWGHQPC